MNTAPRPSIASPDQYRKERLNLLALEKEATKFKDKVNSLRRRLPMTRVIKDYSFAGPHGQSTLLSLFGDKAQLVVYHFMFDPSWDNGCPGCTSFVNALGDLSELADRNTAFALISRAPYEKLADYKEKMGWNRPWFSSYGSDFNYDFHVTHDESKAPIEYNFKTKETLIAENGGKESKGESHGLSVFFRIGDEVFHTYSTYARGVEGLADSYAILDVTPFGRQEDWEDSPEGWPQRPTYG